MSKEELLAELEEIRRKITILEDGLKGHKKYQHSDGELVEKLRELTESSYKFHSVVNGKDFVIVN